jgi:hypothetical protein
MILKSNLTISIHRGLEISQRCGDGHWNAMSRTALHPHATVTTHKKYIILRCTSTGVTVVNGTIKKPFAATSVSTDRISPLYNACDFQQSFLPVERTHPTFQACIIVASDISASELPIA